MSEDQRSLHEEMRPELHEKLRGFVSERDDGALLGPFAPMITWASLGRETWQATKTLLDQTVLPKPAHEVDKDAEGFTRGGEGFPSPGRVAWDAWGGDEGERWVRGIDV